MMKPKTLKVMFDRACFEHDEMRREFERQLAEVLVNNGFEFIGSGCYVRVGSETQCRDVEWERA